MYSPPKAIKTAVTRATAFSEFFTASDNAELINDFGSLEWRIDSVFPGAGSSVS